MKKDMVLFTQLMTRLCFIVPGRALEVGGCHGGDVGFVGFMAGPLILWVIPFMYLCILPIERVG